MSNVKAASDVKVVLGKTREEKLADGLAKSKQIGAKKAEHELCHQHWVKIHREIGLLDPKADGLRATASTPREIEAMMRLDAEIRQMRKALRDNSDRQWKIRSEINDLEREYEAMCDDAVCPGGHDDTPVHEEEDMKIKIEAVEDARTAHLVKQETSKKRQVGGADEEAPMEKKVKVEVVEVKEEM